MPTDKDKNFHARRELSAREIHEILQQAFTMLLGIHGHIGPGVSADTAFAIGEAAGQIAKAKSLIGRDIDNE